jgi:hypothetical protein
MLAIEIARVGELRPAVAEVYRAVYAEVEARVAPLGLTPFTQQAWRSEAEAEANWAKGRRQGPDGSWEIVDPRAIVTRKRRSNHTRRVAVDTYFRVKNDLTASKLLECPAERKVDPPLWDAYQALGEAVRKHGGRWGGDFRTIFDPYHGEWPELELDPFDGPA